MREAHERVRDRRGAELAESDVQAARNAIELYEGELLEGWYQDWCIHQRERYRTMRLALLEKLLSHAEHRYRWDEALTYAETILEEDRAHERTHLRLMRIHVALGDRTAAIRQYVACREALQQEFAVEPGPDVVAVYEQAREGHSLRVADVISTDDVEEGGPTGAATTASPGGPTWLCQPPTPSTSTSSHSYTRRCATPPSSSRGTCAPARNPSTPLAAPHPRAVAAPTTRPPVPSACNLRERISPTRHFSYTATDLERRRRDAAETVTRRRPGTRLPPEEVTVVAAQSFVVRVWSEYRCAQGRPIPRGHITHVLDERRVPITAFDDIIDFIEGYLVDACDAGQDGSAT